MIKRTVRLIIFLILLINYAYAAGDNFRFSTHLNKPDSIQIPAQYSSLEEQNIKYG